MIRLPCLPCAVFMNRRAVAARDDGICAAMSDPLRECPWTLPTEARARTRQNRLAVRVGWKRRGVDERSALAATHWNGAELRGPFARSGPGGRNQRGQGPRWSQRLYQADGSRGNLRGCLLAGKDRGRWGFKPPLISGAGGGLSCSIGRSRPRSSAKPMPVRVLRRPR